MHIYFLPLTSDYTSADTCLVPYVSEKRQAQIRRYVHGHSKKQALYSALLTRMVISRLSGIPASQLQFSCCKNKKPVLLNDASIHFNFSHTNGAVLCGFSLEAPVGVDIETIRKPHPGVAGKTFHPEELAYLDQKNNDASFVEIWTRKEAYTKMLGTGLACELVSINTFSDDLSSCLRTWQEGPFICSACGSLSEFEITKTTIAEIQYFYNQT